MFESMPPIKESTHLKLPTLPQVPLSARFSPSNRFYTQAERQSEVFDMRSKSLYCNIIEKMKKHRPSAIQMVQAAHKYSTANETEADPCRIALRKRTEKTVTTTMFGKGRISYSLLFHASKISEWQQSIISVREESKSETVKQEKDEDAMTTIQDLGP